MADVEASDPSKEVPAQEAAAPAKPVKKTRVSRPERPSREVLTKDLADVNAQIAECQKRIQEIKDLFDGQRQGRQGVEGEIQEAKRQLAGKVAQFRAVMEQKKALREELAAADEARKRMRDEAKSLRDRLPYVKVEQIDEEIAKVEYRMAHMTLTLGEEKKAVQQIRDLTKSKEFVKEYTERMDRISADETLRGTILAKIKEKDEQLNQLKVQEQQQKAAIDALWAKSRTSLDVPALVEERERKHAEIKVHRERIKALHNEFRAKEKEYWDKEQEWRAQNAEDRKKAYEEREAYRKEKEAKRKAWEAENFVEPYTDEIIICDQLVAYVQKLGAPGAEEAKEEEAAKKEVAAEGFGKMVVSKKNRGEEDMDSFFGGLGKGKKKKGARQRDRGERYVSHSLDAISSFAKIKISPPTGTSEFEETVEKIKEKKEEYVKLQAAEREKRALALEKEKEKKEKGEEGAAEKGEEGKEEAKEGGEEAAKEGKEGEGEAKEGAEEDEEAGKKSEAAEGEEKGEAKENGKVEAGELGKKEKAEEAAAEEGKGEGDEGEGEGPGKVKKIVKDFEGLKKPGDEEKAAEGEAAKAEG